MNSNVLRLFHGTTLCSRRILRKNKFLHRLFTADLSRESSQHFSSKYYENKYDEIRCRFTSIPCLDLLKNEIDRFKQDLSYEDDYRLEDLGKWNSKVFEYNSGVTSLLTAEIFLKAYCAYGFSLDDATWNQWDSDRWKSATILAWCIETITAHITIFDDVVDQSISRKRNPCWYKQPGVGLSAITDAQMLQWCNYKVLRKHFGQSKCYLSLLHEFNETNRRMAYGQSMVTYNNANLKSKFEKFTLENYNVYAENQAMQFLLFFPLYLAMHLTGRYSVRECDFMKKIYWKLGLYLQIKDDLLDIVVPVEIIGLKGKDIRDGKFTWFAIKFLEEASESMKKQFMDNYGINEDDAVDNILELYEKTNMRGKFQEFEDQLYAEISTLIESADVIQGALFYDLFHRSQSIKED